MLMRVKCPYCKAVTPYDNSRSYGFCQCCGRRIVGVSHNPQIENPSNISKTRTINKPKNNRNKLITAAVVFASVMMAFGILANNGKGLSNTAGIRNSYLDNDALKTSIDTVAYAGKDLEAMSVINYDAKVETSQTSDPTSTPVPTSTPTPTSTVTPTPSPKPSTPTPTPIPKNRITRITINNVGDFETFLGGDAIQGAANVVKSDPKTYSVTDIVFVSTNPKVATIKSLPQKANTELGFVIEPVSVGETYIYAKTPDGYISSNRVKVKVKAPIEAESISLDCEERTVYAGEHFYLYADISPDNTSIKKVTWTSSDTSVAFVSSSGTVRTFKAGEAEITATTSNGLSATCYVYVEDKPETVDEDDYDDDDYDYDEDYYDEDDYYYEEEYDYYEEEYYEEEYYEEYVWIPATGQRYHCRPDCGRMNPNTAREVTISEAESQGYTPCGNCYR